MEVYDLNTILGMTRGTIGLPFPLPLIDDPKGMVADDFPDKITIGWKKDTAQSKMGKPLYMMNKLGVWEFMPVFLNDIYLPNALVNITGQKTIIETPMTDFEGTVKEIINVQDWGLKIIFTVINEDGSYPEDWLYTMNDLYKLKEILTIDCAFTDAFLQAKDNCLITGLEPLNMQGIENAQVFEISLKSDRYLELEIKN